MMNDDEEEKLDKMVEALETFAQIEGTEYGEYVYMLVNMYTRRECMTDGFKAAFIKEIYETYQYVSEEIEIVEEEVTSTYKTKRIVRK